MLNPGSLLCNTVIESPMERIYIDDDILVLNTDLFSRPPSEHKRTSIFLSMMNRNGNENYYLKVQLKCNLYNTMEIQACFPILGIQSGFSRSKALKPHTPTTIQMFPSAAYFSN